MLVFAVSFTVGIYITLLDTAFQGVIGLLIESAG